jgi:hypothetical protein
LLQELIKQKEELESEERETTERVWKTRRAILDKVNSCCLPQTKPILSSKSLCWESSATPLVTLPQKAELEALDQQRGGVDRESAMLAEEVIAFHRASISMSSDLCN